MSIEPQWYLAELVMEITITGTTRNVVHRNLTLVRADSPAEAYEKSVHLGKKAETSYNNPAGNLVRHVFRGVAELELAVWGVEDGSELRFEEHVGIATDEIERWIPPKEELAVFRELRARPKDDTDYSSAEVIAEAKRRFGTGRPGNT